MVYVTNKDDISVLPLSLGDQNKLRKAGINTVGEMMNYPIEKIVNSRYIDIKCIRGIKDLVRILTFGEYEFIDDENIIGDTGVEVTKEEMDKMDGMILYYKEGSVIGDITIQDLPISVRAKNTLLRGGYKFLSQLIGITYEQLMDIQYMGKKTAEEILGFVDKVTTVKKICTSEYGNCCLDVDEGEGKAESITVENIEDDINVDRLITILYDKEGSVIDDIAIQDLPISVRAKNILLRGGYKFLSQLIGITYEQLMDIQYMGKKTAEELLGYIDKIGANERIYVTKRQITKYETVLVAEMCKAYGGDEYVWCCEILAVKEQYPEAMSETLVYYIYERDLVRKAAKNNILYIIEKDKRGVERAFLDDVLPSHLNNTTVIDEILIELEMESLIRVYGCRFYRLYPSITDFIARIEDIRVRGILEKKICGMTLSEIGEIYGISRERVRQIIVKSLRRRPYLREDVYLSVFDKYNFTLEEFVFVFDEPEATYYYLELVSTTSRICKKILEESLEDTNIDLEYRKKLEKVIYRYDVYIDGNRLKRKRSDLVKYYVKNNCCKQTKFEDFEKGYNSWLINLGLGEDSSLKIETRTYQNILNQSDYVLWSRGYSFRYYNFSGYDFEELLSALNLIGFKNSEFSTLKLFRDYRLMMEQYDVRDEYELHNLLRKLYASNNDDIKFKKMPTIEVGVANVYNQVFDLLLQYAPITQDDLADRYEEKYGVKAVTAKSGCLRGLERYLNDGVYTIENKELPLEQFDRMQELLTEDFYTIQNVKRLYKKEFPDTDDSLLNSYTLKTLGFRVYSGYSGYIVRNTFSGATDYFRDILTKNDIVDLRGSDFGSCGIVTYSSEYYRLRNNYEIVEFSPLQYINIRRLNKMGVTKKDLKDYCSAVAKYCKKGEYFTVTSLRNDGFIHVLDGFGFEEWFYSSVLFEDCDSFSAQRMGGTRIFLCGEQKGDFAGMLIWLLDKYKKIDFFDLLDLLKKQYGIFVSKDKLVSVIKNTELYYDTIMEAVYKNYDIYFEEL